MASPSGTLSSGDRSEKSYKIMIDKKEYEAPASHLTGKEILALAGKTPAGYRLDQKLHGGQVKKIGPDETVDLTAPGLEKFMTLPLDQTDGGAPQAAD